MGHYTNTASFTFCLCVSVLRQVTVGIIIPLTVMPLTVCWGEIAVASISLYSTDIIFRTAACDD